MNAVPVVVWLLAWVGSTICGSLVLASLWIRVRDNARREGIDLDALDRPAQSGADVERLLVERERQSGRSLQFLPGPDSLRLITETSTGDGEDVVRRWVQRGNDQPTPLGPELGR